MGLILAYEVPNQKRSRRGIERVCGESGAVIWVAVVGDGKPMLCVVVTRGWVGWVQQQHILKKEGQQLEKVQAGWCKRASRSLLSVAERWCLAK